LARRVVCVSATPGETQAIGAALAPVLHPGDVVALSGDLGAGKTCLVQGAAAALGVRTRVTSPSFVLVREYEGGLPVLHLDIYRLGNLQELVDLGYEEFLDPKWVVFIEWGDAAGPLLPEEYLQVDLRRADDDSRTITIEPHGPQWTRRLAEARERLSDWERMG
jgi:tRNA threonylcarbamoyladenosine biosynthesis protein TsaE